MLFHPWPYTGTTPGTGAFRRLRRPTTKCIWLCTELPGLPTKWPPLARVAVRPTNMAALCQQEDWTSFVRRWCHSRTPIRQLTYSSGSEQIIYEKFWLNNPACLAKSTLLISPSKLGYLALHFSNNLLNHPGWETSARPLTNASENFDGRVENRARASRILYRLYKRLPSSGECQNILISQPATHLDPPFRSLSMVVWYCD